MKEKVYLEMYLVNLWQFLGMTLPGTAPSVLDEREVSGLEVTQSPTKLPGDSRSFFCQIKTSSQGLT